MKVDVTVAGISARISAARHERLRHEAVNAALAELAARATAARDPPPISTSVDAVEPNPTQQR